MYDIVKIPKVIISVFFKISTILLVLSLILNAVTLGFALSTIQIPIDTLNNSIMSNNYVTPEVATLVTGSTTLIPDYSVPSMLSVFQSSAVHDIEITNRAELLNMGTRNYEDTVTYEIKMKIDLVIWTLFGGAKVPVDYPIEQTVVCYRKVR